MCTVVVRREAGEPVRILALRDEDLSREFDEPGSWWPEHHGVIGGRDRTAGGSWCVTDVATGTTALVLNRSQKMVAEPGAPSRGVLPLWAVQSDWRDHVDITGMASFELVVVGPDVHTSWIWDGAVLERTDIPDGVTMFTSGGPEDVRAERHLARFEDAAYPVGWRDMVTEQPPVDDRSALVVRHAAGGKVYGTVFGQLIEALPGRLSLSSSRTPWVAGSWRDVRYS